MQWTALTDIALILKQEITPTIAGKRKQPKFTCEQENTMEIKTFPASQHHVACRADCYFADAM